MLFFLNIWCDGRPLPNRNLWGIQIPSHTNHTRHQIWRVIVSHHCMANQKVDPLDFHLDHNSCYINRTIRRIYQI